MTFDAAIDSTVLLHIPVFQGLSESQRQEVVRLGELKSLAPGDLLLRQGQTSQDLWVLLEGTCEVFKQLTSRPATAEPTLLAVLEPYSSIGEMSCFSPAPHSASVRAKSAARLFRLPRASFDDLMARNPAITSRLAANTIGSLAERMRHMDDWVVELLAHKPADPRIPEWSELRRRVFDGWKL
ncbi:MAG: cyclic nucleotide-binding domain-containing protein [Singulisphaera sp.]